MNTKPIIFRKGEENGIVVERDHFENSIFIDQYRKAFSTLKSIWDLQDTYSDETELVFDNRFSNIIAFCGNRGEGKSSCLTSFAKMLQDDSIRNSAYKIIGAEWSETTKTFMSKNVKSDKIEILPPIDPSFFDSTHNILELLIGRMFKQMTDRIKSNKLRDVNSCYCTELQRQFQNVQRCMKNMVDNSGYAFDTLERLSDLASAVQLKKEIDNLFNQYLIFMGKEGGRIIISIDDLDLNIAGAYEMSEHIRKYLINSHCIILLAVKAEQLSDVIADNMSSKMPAKIVNQSDFIVMSNNYVSKFLPLGNRVQMPSTNDICDRRLIIEDENGAQTIINKDNGENYITVKEYVVRLIYLKTGYVFYNNQYPSPIIPNSLRTLRHLLAMLDSMPNAVEYSDYRKIDHEEGREQFKNYFYYIWTERLDTKDQTFVQTLKDYEDLTSLNKYVVDNFSDRIAENNILSDSVDAKDNRLFALYNNIVKKSNVAANISLGDVMFILWWIDKMTMDIKIKNLIFWLRSFYSMKLYACYNAISSEFIDSNITNSLYPSYSIEVNIHKADSMYNHVNYIQRLVNGSFFTYPHSYLLQKSGNNSAPRDHKVITLKGIKSLFADLGKHQINDETPEYIQTLRLCEYAALTISRTAYYREKEADLGLNRTIVYPTYLGPISDHSNYAVFDFLLPFYSLCNLQYSYNRFDNLQYPNRGDKEIEQLQKEVVTESADFTISLYNRAKICKQSLLNHLLNDVPADEYHSKKMHNLISDGIIRIIDVQWAIVDYLIYQRDKHKSQSTDTQKLIDAYADLQNLNIKLYSPKETRLDNPRESESLYSISFAFLTPIIKYLSGTLDGKKSDEEYKKFNQSFERIFMPASLDINDADVKETENIFSDVLEKINYPIVGEEATHILSSSPNNLGKSKSSLTRRLNTVLQKDKQYNSQEELIAQLASKIAYLKETK